jgi:RNA polymerase sigma factor (sigma-70 family)
MPHTALTASEELALAREIIEAEQRARAELEHIQALQGLLGARGKGSERTRAGAVERLGRAVEAARELGRHDPEARRRADRAAAELRLADERAWQLAMSERRIATVEAKKLGTQFLDAPDLVQEGYLGLLDAARRFEPGRGLRFSTYARWWVRARMTRAIDNTGRLVRLPGNAVEQLRNLRKAELLGASTADELASWAGIDTDRLEALRASGPAVSLDQRIDEDGRSLGEELADETAVDASESSELREAAQRLREAMRDVLDEREHHVLSQRYGLQGDQDVSLSEIARRMDLSRERVRQIERRALRGLAERMGGSLPGRARAAAS